MKGDEELVFTNDSIYIKDTIDQKTAVMHIGEKELMHKLADIVTINGGDILEIGFGMHLSADRVQSTQKVTSHTIIEIHKDIYINAIEWAKDKPNVEIILGDWIDVIPTLNKKFNGVLHDTHLDSNLSKFLEIIKPNLSKGCIVGFFQYDNIDNRLDGIRYSLPIEEYQKLPYKNSNTFVNNQFELKYTTFNGVDFYKSTNVNKLF
jgi:guanidinoacetate N-methyltransferase